VRLAQGRLARRWRPAVLPPTDAGPSASVGLDRPGTGASTEAGLAICGDPSDIVRHAGYQLSAFEIMTGALLCPTPRLQSCRGRATHVGSASSFEVKFPIEGTTRRE
jgi:hypothetical protein